DEVERLAAFELYAVDLFRIEEDVMARRALIALDDLLAVDRPDARDDLLIFDALARWLVHLVKLDRSPALGRRKQLDGNRHQRERDLSPPNRTRSHSNSPSSAGFNSFRHRVVPCNCFQ